MIIQTKKIHHSKLDISKEASKSRVAAAVLPLLKYFGLVLWTKCLTAPLTSRPSMTRRARRRTAPGRLLENMKAHTRMAKDKWTRNFQLPMNLKEQLDQEKV